jgi:hypothetical protein
MGEDLREDDSSVLAGPPYPKTYGHYMFAKTTTSEMEQHKIISIWGENPVWGAPLIHNDRYESEKSKWDQLIKEHSWISTCACGSLCRGVMDACASSHRPMGRYGSSGVDVRTFPGV